MEEAFLEEYRYHRQMGMQFDVHSEIPKTQYFPSQDTSYILYVAS